MPIFKSTLRISSVLFIVVCVFVCSLGFFVGSVFFPKGANSSESSTNIQLTGFAKLSNIVAVLNKGFDYQESNGQTTHIDGFYYKDRLNTSKLEDFTIKGLLAGLSDFPTKYYSPQEYSQYKDALAGSIFGIGIEIGNSEIGPKVGYVYEDTPAFKAGLKKGDVFIKVNDLDVSKLTASDVANNVRGLEGTKVHLTLKRDQTLMDFDLVRAKIQTNSIKYEKLSDGVCKISIQRFTEDTVEKWKSNWNRAVGEYLSDNCQKLLLDLRNNGGGYVEASEYAIGEFVEDGKTIYGKKNNSGQIENVTSLRDAYANSGKSSGVDKTGQLRNTKLVILVNAESASASEIFSGSLQALNRAKLIGVNTYGKGSVQYTYNIQDGSALVYTVQNWTLPNGQVIDQNYPIKVDYTVTNSDTDPKDKDVQQDKAIEVLKSL
jgi:carboxyl-terminal processing protease